MSKHINKIRFIIHYVKPTAQLLFKIRFPKGGPTCRRQVVNPVVGFQQEITWIGKIHTRIVQSSIKQLCIEQSSNKRTKIKRPDFDLTRPPPPKKKALLLSYLSRGYQYYHAAS